jgi:hypothetical protein
LPEGMQRRRLWRNREGMGNEPDSVHTCCPLGVGRKPPGGKENEYSGGEQGNRPLRNCPTPGGLPRSSSAPSPAQLEVDGPGSSMRRSARDRRMAKTRFTARTERRCVSRC